MLIHLLCSPEFWIGVAATLSLLVAGALVFLVAEHVTTPPIGGAQIRNVFATRIDAQDMEAALRLAKSDLASIKVRTGSPR